MRLLPSALLALAALTPLAAKDLATKQSAKIDITTNTSYGFSLDNPNQRGLDLSFSHFGISYDFVNGGVLSNEVKTDDPYGFVQVEFGGLHLQWGSLSSLYDKDQNNNANGTGYDTKLGFNGAGTGYTYPIYLERFVSGVNFGPWFLQLAAGGDQPENWRPWSNILRGSIKSEILQRMAYPDVRIQYQRPNVPTLLSKQTAYGIPDEGQYWNTGNPYQSNGDVMSKGPLQDLVLNPKGALVGLSFTETDWSTQLKFATETSWTATPSAGDPPGEAAALDFVIAPVDLPGLRASASVGGTVDYGSPGTPQPWAAGAKTGYTFSVTEAVSLEPYLGVQIKHWDKVGAIGNLQYKNAHEVSAGLTIHWPGEGGWQWDPLQQRNGVLFPGLSLAYTLRDNNDLYDTSASSQVKPGSNPIQSVLVTLYEESGDGGLLEGWGAEGAVQFVDFQNFGKGFGATSSLNQLLATLYLDYSVNDVAGGVLVPWTKVFYDFIGRETGGSVQNLKTDAGLRLEKAVKNTTFGLTYESKNLLGTSSGATDLVNGGKGWGLARVWAEVRL